MRRTARALITVLVLVAAGAAGTGTAYAATPEAFPDFVEAQEGGTTTLTLNGFDDDGDPLTFAIATSPTGGTLGTFGTPDCSAGFCSADVVYTDTPTGGDDSFTFTVNDGTATSAAATVDISVVAAPCTGAIISNGTVQLGVNCTGNLNTPGGTPSSETGTTEVGLRLVATNAESTAPGCLCEGWGAADATTNVTGYANESAGTDNVSIVSFTSDADSATSKVAIGSTFEVTHDYQPSTVANALYKVTVSIKNTSASAVHLRYRRVMDWDVEPTAFNEFSTVQKGTASEIVFTSNDGFATADPLAGPSDIGSTGNFTDAGPNDHGALFDFDFGSLATGVTKTFTTFYGAAGTEAAASAALSAVGAEAYSFGQPSTPDGATVGTPNTFIFAFAGVGGTPVFSPDAVDDTLVTSAGTANSVNVLTNDTDPNGDTLTVTTASPTAAHGTVSCASTGSCTYTPAAGYSGPDSFSYAISDGHGGSDTATVSVTVTPVSTPPPVDVRIEKVESADPVPVGNLFSYRLVVSNTSTAHATGVSVSDPLPAGFRLRDVATGQGACTTSSGTVNCAVGALAPGASATLTVNGAFVSSGSKTNTATVSATGDANSTNNQASTVTAVTGKTCTVIGTFGDDNPLLGTNKADVICGLSGDDRINGKQGNDTIYGNEGNDRLNGLGGDDHLDGGPGTDTVTYASLQQSVRVDLGRHKATGQGADTLVSIENATGSPGDDLLVGSSGRNRLTGGGGADRLSGLGGVDALLGGAGPDVLDGGDGKDSLNGGAGGDTCRPGGGGGSKKSC